MKKSFVFLLVFVSLFLIACSSDISDLKPIVKNFRCDFSIKNSDFSGQMFVDEQGNITLDYEQPNNINGTRLQVNENELTVETLGISKKYDKANK